MININCSTKEEADKVIGVFDIFYSVLDNDISIPYEEISVTVNNEPYQEWDSFVDGLKLIENLQ